MVSFSRASCSVGANSNTHPFQEWHSAILATRIRAKKIRNFSSKHKWKDECKAKRKGPRFNMHIVKCHIIVRHVMNIEWTWTCVNCQKADRYNLLKRIEQEKAVWKNSQVTSSTAGAQGEWKLGRWMLSGNGETFSVAHILILFEFQTMWLYSRKQLNNLNFSKSEDKKIIPIGHSVGITMNCFGLGVKSATGKHFILRI